MADCRNMLVALVAIVYELAKYKRLVAARTDFVGIHGHCGELWDIILHNSNFTTKKMPLLASLLFLGV